MFGLHLIVHPTIIGSLPCITCDVAWWNLWWVRDYRLSLRGMLRTVGWGVTYYCNVIENKLDIIRPSTSCMSRTFVMVIVSPSWKHSSGCCISDCNIFNSVESVKCMNTQSPPSCDDMFVIRLIVPVYGSCRFLMYIREMARNYKRTLLLALPYLWYRVSSICVWEWGRVVWIVYTGCMVRECSCYG